MKALWGKDDATQAKHLRSLGPAKAWEAIDAFCRSRADGKRKDPPTIQEVMDRLKLTAQEVQPQQRAARVVEGMALDLTLIDEQTIAVGLDTHQNKHQSRVIMALGQYAGGKAGKWEKGGKFSTEADEEWHRTNTAPVVRRWVEGLNRAGNLDPPGKIVNTDVGDDPEDQGYSYIASAMKDSTGRLYGSYHCYPL